jgi:hypothetical protein
MNRIVGYYVGHRLALLCLLPPACCSRPTRPAVFSAGRRFAPSAPAWTDSNTGKRVMKSPDRHRTARSLSSAWRIDPNEPNAWGAPLCAVTVSRLVLGKRCRRCGESEALGLAVSSPPLSAVGRSTSYRRTGRTPGALPPHAQTNGLHTCGASNHYRPRRPGLVQPLRLPAKGPTTLRMGVISGSWPLLVISH